MLVSRQQAPVAVPCGPPPAHGIVFGLVLATPFWCCLGAVLWALR